METGRTTAGRGRTAIKPLERIFARHVSEGTVTEVGLVTPTLKRIRIRCETVDTWSYVPGQHVRVEINDPLSLYGILRPGDTLRTYTVWDLSVADRTTPHAIDHAAMIDLTDALARLDPKDRAIVGLRFIGGFESAEVGRAMGMTASGVRVRLHRLLERLRKDLGDD